MCPTQAPRLSGVVGLSLAPLNKYSLLSRYIDKYINTSLCPRPNRPTLPPILRPLTLPRFIQLSLPLFLTFCPLVIVRPLFGCYPLRSLCRSILSLLYLAFHTSCQSFTFCPCLWLAVYPTQNPTPIYLRSYPLPLFFPS